MSKQYNWQKHKTEFKTGKGQEEFARKQGLSDNCNFIAETKSSYKSWLSQIFNEASHELLSLANGFVNTGYMK